jgi:Arc/MetJ-type ribon-helix-helix transcriptional regulator
MDKTELIGVRITEPMKQCIDLLVEGNKLWRNRSDVIRQALQDFIELKMVSEPLRKL